MKHKVLDYNKLLTTEKYVYLLSFKKVKDNFNQLWQMKNSIRESLRCWLLTIQNTGIDINIIGNCFDEILENCIKYSLEGYKILVRINTHEKYIYINSFNVSSEKNIAYLDDLLQEIDSSDNEDLYIRNLTNLLENKRNPLGLLRIINETGGNISLLNRKQGNNVMHLRIKINVGNLTALCV